MPLPSFFNMMDTEPDETAAFPTLVAVNREKPVTLIPYPNLSFPKPNGVGNPDEIDTISNSKEVVCAKDVDVLLAQELNQMTFKERETVYEELHGVDTIIEETEDFIHKTLEDVNRELSKIRIKPAYEQAESMSKEYVTSRKFRLMFLRAEYFNVRKAAGRLVKFMEEKLQLFGSNALARPLYLSDLDKDTQETLKSGVFQWIGARDRTGRSIIASFQKLVPARCYKRTENMVRNAFYLMRIDSNVHVT
jgi:hypothetical protein